MRLSSKLGAPRLARWRSVFRWSRPRPWRGAVATTVTFIAAAGPIVAAAQQSVAVAAAFHGGGGWHGGGTAFRGGGGGWHGGHAGGGGYGNGYGGGYGYGAAALGLGLLGGAIIGSQYPYYDSGYDDGASYDVSPQDGGGDSMAYCVSTFRSFDPASGTYLGYDGLRHPCP